MTDDRSYKGLIVWQESVSLVKQIYMLTSKFPPEEKFGMAELDTQLIISIEPGFCDKTNADECFALMTEVRKMLNALRRSLLAKSASA